MTTAASTFPSRVFSTCYVHFITWLPTNVASALETSAPQAPRWAEFCEVPVVTTVTAWHQPCGTAGAGTSPVTPREMIGEIKAARKKVRDSVSVWVVVMGVVVDV